jgi:hypothetical protein
LKDLQQQIWLEFHRKLEPDLTQAIRKATAPAQFDDLRKQIKDVSAKMPVEEVRTGLAVLEKELEHSARQALATQQREQLETFKRVLAAAKQAAGNGDINAFTNAADLIELQRPLLAEPFRPTADQFARDLRAVQAIYEKSWQVLSAKGEARESVALYFPAGAKERTTLKLNGKAGVDGVWHKGSANKEDRLTFVKLDDRDVLAMAGITEATEEGRKKLGAFFFWKNHPGRAYELLSPFRKDQTSGLYLVWIDLQARQMIEAVEELHRQVTTMKLSIIEREQRRQQAEKLVVELKNEFGATEVYHERTQSK